MASLIRGTYPTFSELGGVLFPFGTPKEKRLVALLTAYLDDSGTHDGSKHVVVCGLVALQDDWDVFSERWCEAVSVMGLARWHATDAEALRGEYTDWTVDRREAGFRELREIIADVPRIISVGAFVQPEMWDRYLPPAGRDLFKTPYVLACHIVFSGLGVKLVEQGIDRDAWIAYVLDRAKGYGVMEDVFNAVAAVPERREKYRLATVAAGDSLMHPPLQAADIVAYEMNKDQTRWQERRPNRRYTLQRLVEILPKRWDRADATFLSTLDKDPISALYPI